MKGGIYPDYVGPTIASRFKSLYPDWLGDNFFEIEVEEPAGGGSQQRVDDLKNTRHGRRLIREDEEVLAVIMAAMRVMQ